VCPSPLEQTGKREEENHPSIPPPLSWLYISSYFLSLSLSPFYAQAQKGRDYLLSNIEPLSLLAYYTRT
jgi:hypothetical protein